MLVLGLAQEGLAGLELLVGELGLLGKALGLAVL